MRRQKLGISSMIPYVGGRKPAFSVVYRDVFYFLEYIKENNLSLNRDMENSLIFAAKRQGLMYEKPIDMNDY